MRHQKILTCYFIELLSAHILFFAIYFISAVVWKKMPTGLGQMLVLCSPVLPVCLMLVAVWALTAAITFLWTFAYGLLESVGWPHLSLIWICPAMGVVSAIVFLMRGLAIRRTL
jgi:hypothetical protein